MAISEHEVKTNPAHPRAFTIPDDATLLHDERWLLVQRILASPGLQRADQLRKILLYTARHAILQTDDSIREYEIACNVLGRRTDFDPGSDNIVRVQISHLRRKLEGYFAVEGIDETIHLTIPRGSYAASFKPAIQRPAAPRVETEPARSESDERNASPPVFALSAGLATPNLPVASPPWTRRELLLLSTLVIALVLAAAAFAVRGTPAPVPLAAVPPQSPFLKPLLANHKNIAVVLPDTSLMIVQTLLGEDLSVGDYLKDFPQQQFNQIADPALRRAFIYIAGKQTTSYAEASAAYTLSDRLSRYGAPVTIRYARDLHVHDMGDGNIVLLGSRRSNPWNSLFTDKTNFRVTQDPKSHEFVFSNTHPLPGERTTFVPEYSNGDRQVTYVDIALVPNLTNSGFVLLVNGSDVQATEAAARFMLGGTWPPEIQKLFTNRDQQFYEVFLRCVHIASEAPNDFETVAVRSEIK